MSCLVFEVQTPSKRFAHYLWAFALSFQYAFANSEDTTVDEKRIQWEHVENGRHFVGEHSLLNEVQREELQHFQGTQLQAGIREHVKIDDIVGWV